MGTRAGGEAVVHLLKKQVTEWPSAGRGAVACEAIRALSVSGRDSALVLVDSIARNFKYRQVKEAATSAFDLAAQELGMDREALADRVVPTFGFGVNGERRIDFGSQTFLLKLSQKLEIEIAYLAAAIHRQSAFAAICNWFDLGHLPWRQARNLFPLYGRRYYGND